MRRPEALWRGTRSDDIRDALAPRLAELRYSVSIARGHARFLLDGRGGSLTGEQRRSLQAIARQADRLDRLLQRIEAGSGPTSEPATMDDFFDGTPATDRPGADSLENSASAASPWPALLPYSPTWSSLSSSAAGAPSACASEVARASTNTSPLAQTIEPVSPTVPRARVLVADDDDEVLAVLHDILSDRYDVTVCRNGGDALRRLRDDRFHLAIVDLQLPIIDGFELAQRLRASSETPPAFMFLSAESNARVKTIGINLGAWDYVAKPFHHEELMARVARIVSSVLREQSLRAEALTDPMTGLSNYRNFSQNLAREIERSKRYRLPLSLITIDLDNLKRINDEAGHERGNEAIRTVARVLKGAVRSFETVARQGGDEFAILLPNTSNEEAVALAERLRAEVATHKVLDHALSISVGVASCGPGHDTDFATLVEKSDQALYRAKRGGRNRVAPFA